MADPASSPEPLQSFVERVRDQLPAVVEVVEGIYGRQESSSEARDFSNGDILRLLAVRERVNVTFESFYSAASRRGLITLERDFRGAQFAVVSGLADGHVYATFDQLFEDGPLFIHATAGLTLAGGGDGGDAADRAAEGERIETGDRLKLLDKSQAGADERWIRCRNLRTGRCFRLTRRRLLDAARGGRPGGPPAATPFAKRVSRSLPTATLGELYPLLPQRVRMVRDLGQVLRGEQAIPGLEPADYDGELLLSRTEIVEACTWEDPERVFALPATTGVFVQPRPDWAERVGPVVDVQQAAGGAVPGKPKAAVVVDQDSQVPGCPKDTLLLLHGVYEGEFAMLRGRKQTHVLVPMDYPSLFKITLRSWPTVRDLLKSNVSGEVHVGTTARLHSDDPQLGALYEHDVVCVTDHSVTERVMLSNGADGDVEAVWLQRVRSLKGQVGQVRVPLDLRAGLYVASPLLGDVRLGKILDAAPSLGLPVPITLSRPQALGDRSESAELLHPSDDLLLTVSPLAVTGLCRLRVAVVSPGLVRRPAGGAVAGGAVAGIGPDLIAIPECQPLAVRALTRRPQLLAGQAAGEAPGGLLPPTTVIRITEAEADALPEGVYEGLTPPVPARRGSQPAIATSAVDKEPPKSLSPPPRPPRSKHHPKSPTEASMTDPDKPPLTPPPRPAGHSKLALHLPSNFTFPKRRSRKISKSEAAGFNEQRPKMRLPTENPYNPIDNPDINQKFSDTVTLSDQEDYSIIGETTDDDYDYMKPDLIPQGEAPSPFGTDFPPKDGNISRYSQAEMLRFLQYLRVDRCVLDTFRRRQIDGCCLVELRRRCSDDMLKKELGVQAIKDWFALLHFITKSSGQT